MGSENDSLLPPFRNKTPINPDNATNLETAVNDVYEAIIDNDQDYDNSTNEDITWLREQRTLNKTTHWLKRPSVIMLGIIPFLFALATSSGESTRQVITLKLACNFLSEKDENGGIIKQCNATDAQLLMSNLQMCFSVCSGIITLIASGKIGPLSDQYGRRLFIIISVSFFFLGRTLKFLLMYHFTSLKFIPMVFFEILTNLGGGSISLVTLSNCYISDVVEPHERIYSLGLGIASLFIGFSTGPLIGNFLLSLSTKMSNSIDINTTIAEGEFVPLKFELCIYAIVALYSIFVLPESRSAKARRKSRSLSISSSSSLILTSPHLASQEDTPTSIQKFINQINFLKPLRLLLLPEEVVNRQNMSRVNKDRAAVMMLIISDCILAVTGISLGEINILYGIYNFGWSQRDIGHLLAIGFSTKATVLIILCPIINHKVFQKGFKFKVMRKQFDMVDFSMIYLGLSCEALGLLLLMFMPTTHTFFAGIMLAGLGSISSPALNSSVIKFYPESKIGELFGAIALLKNLLVILGPVTFLSIYKYALEYWNKPGAVFFVAGSIMFFNSNLVMIVKRVLNLTSHSEPELLTRSNSRVSLFEDSIGPLATDMGPSDSASSTPTQPTYTELHRKSSFLRKERTVQD
ncbi:major facilitator superfamily domain-containing protein [Scheffersomyces coipomensis]|uniref:major facilitator superfamily domain-containing protein n=1 Tax=Scheffersomyces coipomensis TaxID=1788519 RepID=UPI00315CD55A